MTDIPKDRTVYQAFESEDDYIEMLEACIEQSEIGFLIADATGNVIKVNQAQINITGQDPSYNLGRNMRDVQFDDQSPSATVIVAETLKPVKLEQNLPNGRSYLVYSSPHFGKDGQLKFIISNLLDATEIRKTKESLQSLKDDNKRLNIQLQELRNQMEVHCQIIHQSKIMRQVILLCDRVAQFDSNVLIQGESGVGKEKIAEYIFEKSGRNGKSFIKINCAAIPENLLESELFGYEPGSFTNANAKGKKGLLEYANEGTLLLDEVNELALPLQAKLLRFIQEGEFYRIGGIKPIASDVRILAAANKNLEALVHEGKFREDLYYRLNVIPIHVPPLRERKEDIPLLAGYFVNKFNEKHQLKKSITNHAAIQLQEFPFYGNVRELQNTIERILVLSESDLIDTEDIENFMKGIESEQKENMESSLQELMGDYEKKILMQYVEKYGNQEKISQVLKVSQSTISRKLELHKIKISNNR